jgi:hypothetical protein
MAIIIKHIIVKTELSEKPETDSSGVTTPKISREIKIKKAVLSTVNFSVTKSKKAPNKIARTISMGVVTIILRILRG